MDGQIRGDIKQVNHGIIKSVDFLGCERLFGMLMLGFCFVANIILFPSFYEILVFLATFIGLMIGRSIYKNDPYYFGIFLNNLTYEEESKKYLLPQANPNLKKTFKIKPKSLRK
jgi:hypothetical protein